MSSSPARHPSDRRLVAFNLGKLPNDEAAAVNKHLKECQPCRRRLVKLSAEPSVPGAKYDATPAEGMKKLVTAIQSDHDFVLMAGPSPSPAWRRFVWPAVAAVLVLGIVIAWGAGAFKSRTAATLAVADMPQPAPLPTPSPKVSQAPVAPPSVPKPATVNRPVTSAPSGPPAGSSSPSSLPPTREGMLGMMGRPLGQPSTEPKKEEPPKELASLSENPPNDAKKAAHDFFNGKDLAGWQGAADTWRVNDGVIQASLPAGQTQSAFLLSQRTYKDFDLQFRVTLADEIGDCGVQFRSRVTDPEKFQVEGPQCAIYGKNPPKDRSTGSLVLIPQNSVLKAPPLKRVERFVKPGENSVRIRCQGKHILIEVNKIKMVNGEFPSVPDEGVIAWKIDGSRPFHKVSFKITKFAELTSVPSQESPEQPSLADASLLKAEMAFATALENADNLLLNHFDPETEKLRKSHRPQERELAPVVEHEKDVFKEKGLIPWSHPMRKAVMQYAKDLLAARKTIGGVFDRAIERAEKSHNETLKETLLAEAGKILAPREVAIWIAKNGRRHLLYSDGTFATADKPELTDSRFWIISADDQLVFEFPAWDDPNATAEWAFRIALDGRSATTHNPKNEQIAWTRVDE